MTCSNNVASGFGLVETHLIGLSRARGIIRRRLKAQMLSSRVLLAFQRKERESQFKQSVFTPDENLPQKDSSL